MRRRLRLDLLVPLPARGGPAERADPWGWHVIAVANLCDHLSHAEQGAFFESFGCADDHGLRAQVRPHPLNRWRQCCEGHHAHHDGCALKRFCKISAGHHAGRDGLAGKKLLIHALLCDGQQTSSSCAHSRTWWLSLRPRTIDSAVPQDSLAPMIAISLDRALRPPTRLSVPAKQAAGCCHGV